MRITHFFILLYFFVFLNCKQKKLQLFKIEGEQISISDTLRLNSEIEAFIKPYRKHIQKDLDSVLAYSVDTFSKNNGYLNTAIGNFLADVIFNEANPIFKSRTDKEIDMVLLNHGSIRSALNKGSISKRTAFQLMPFENSIVVVALKSSQLDSLMEYLRTEKKAHPISGLKLSIDKNYNIIQAKIRGGIIEKDKTYYVATSDYLYNGGDNMHFFKPNDSVYFLNYKVRNALIDTFNKLDTVKPVMDNRFIQIK